MFLSRLEISSLWLSFELLEAELRISEAWSQTLSSWRIDVDRNQNEPVGPLSGLDS